jgi:hypothetical protein
MYTNALAKVKLNRHRKRLARTMEQMMTCDGTIQSPKTLTVPEAGKKYFDLSRGASYAAAARGDIPTVKIGRKLRVPIIAVERMLESVGRPATETRS